MEKRSFKIAMSERCYRFKPDALVNHAPDKPGVYEFVMFDQKLQPIILFIGLALPSSVREALTGHLMGNLRPAGDTLFKISKDIYFDYVASANIESPEDYKDIAAFLIAEHRPRLNGSAPANGSGRYAEVTVEEAD